MLHVRPWFTFAWLGVQLALISCYAQRNPIACKVDEDCPTNATCSQGYCFDVPAAGSGPSNPQPADPGPTDPQATCIPSTTTCSDAGTLLTCRQDGSGDDVSSCLLGCSAGSVAHCNTLAPSAPVLGTDIELPGLSQATLAAGDALFNTDTGEISGALIRAPNRIYTNTEVTNGIAFRQQAGVGIFVFASFTIPSGSTVKLVGSDTAALVTEGDFTVDGVVDARPMDLSGSLCPAGSPVGGPGGGAGGVAAHIDGGGSVVPGTSGQGAGGGGPGTTSIQGTQAGGGGGGHSAAGAQGGNGIHLGPGTVFPGGSGGVAYDDPAFEGGSGGGGSGRLTQGMGGGGGGGVRLVSGGVLNLGDGSSTAGVNAGGCGGAIDGGGGGSGGSILLEAPIVQMNAGSVLAANGGGGGDTNGPGAPGGLGSTVAYGSSSGPGFTGAGNGGGGDSPAGGAPNTSPVVGFGAGGAAGRIRILSRDGSLNLHPSAVISPSTASGAAVLGTVNVQ